MTLITASYYTPQMCFRSFLFMKETLIIYQQAWEVRELVEGLDARQESHIQDPHTAPTSVCNIKHEGIEMQYLSF